MGDTFYRLCSMGLAVGACGVVGIAPAISIKSTGPVLPSHKHEPRYACLKPVTHQAGPICYLPIGPYTREAGGEGQTSDEFCAVQCEENIMLVRIPDGLSALCGGHGCRARAVTW